MLNVMDCHLGEPGLGIEYPGLSQGHSDGGYMGCIYIYIPQKLSPSRVEMTSELLLNMSTEVLYLPKKFIQFSGYDPGISAVSHVAHVGLSNLFDIHCVVLCGFKFAIRLEQFMHLNSVVSI